MTTARGRLTNIIVTENDMLVDPEFVRRVGTIKWLRRTAIRQFCKRVLRRDNWVTLPTGLRMRLPRMSRFSSEAFVTGCNVDWGSEAILASLLDPAGAFLDIGANVGYYSLYMLPKVAAVHAFEPDTRAVVDLRKNLSAYPNAYVHFMALADHVGTSGFVQAKSTETSHLAGSAATHEVELTTVDIFVAERQLSVSGIKIDVEGADLEVLHGAKHTLRLQHPLVLTESEPGEKLFDLIEPLGYRVFAFVGSEGEFHFRKFDRGNRGWTKMLFLVPPALHSRFVQIAETRAANPRFAMQA